MGNEPTFDRSETKTVKRTSCEETSHNYTTVSRIPRLLYNEISQKFKLSVKKRESRRPNYG